MYLDPKPPAFLNWGILPLLVFEGLLTLRPGCAIEGPESCADTTARTGIEVRFRGLELRVRSSQRKSKDPLRGTTYSDPDTTLASKPLQTLKRL